jgi:hypothetical protein
MQVIIDEIVSNVRAVDPKSTLSPEVMRQIVDACVKAVREMMAKDCRMKEEKSIDGPWSTQPRSEREGR